MGFDALTLIKQVYIQFKIIVVKLSLTKKYIDNLLLSPWWVAAFRHF